jgi:hypothetical protein
VARAFARLDFLYFLLFNNLIFIYCITSTCLHFFCKIKCSSDHGLDDIIFPSLPLPIVPTKTATLYQSRSRYHQSSCTTLSIPDNLDSRTSNNIVIYLILTVKQKDLYYIDYQCWIEDGNDATASIQGRLWINQTTLLACRNLSTLYYISHRNKQQGLFGLNKSLKLETLEHRSD